MAEIQKTSILGRKTRNTQNDVGASDDPLCRALRIGLERTADDLLGLQLCVSSASQRTVGWTAFEKLFASNAMYALLEGGDGIRAGVIIDMPVLCGLVEHETIGRVSPTPAEDRRPTKVDAALVAPLIDETLVRLDADLEGAHGQIQSEGLCFGAMAPDSRGLILALEDTRYVVIDLLVSLASGAKSGSMRFVLPMRRVAKDKPAKRDHTDTSKQEFRNSVLRAPATLNVVLTRMELALTDLQNLMVGQVIPIKGDVIDKAVLELPNGQHVSAASLGQMNGMKAVRVLHPDLPRNTSSAPPEAEPAPPEEDVVTPNPAAPPVLAPRVEVQDHEEVENMLDLVENFDDLEIPDDLLSDGAGLPEASLQA